MGLILRLLYLLWIVGFFVLLAVATSQMIFGRSEAPLRRWFDQLAASLLWPLALFSRAGRESLKTRFRGGAGSPN